MYAQISEPLEKLRTLTFDVEIESGGKVQETSRQMFHVDGHLRVERSDGTVVVSRRSADGTVVLVVDRNKKTARKVYTANRDEGLDPISFLFAATKKGRVGQSGEREIGGRICDGFVVNHRVGDSNRQQQIRFWVDQETNFIVYSEFTIEQPQSSTPEAAASKTVARCSNFKYGAKLDEAAFSVTPPRGYDVTTVGSPPSRLTDKLVITLGEGMGRAKFGMTKDEVANALGEPDEKKEIRGGSMWTYDSRGFHLTFDQLDAGHLVSIACHMERRYRSAEFTGATAEGIGIGSSQEDVLRAYGEPEEDSVRDGLGAMRYFKLGMTVGIAKGKVADLQAQVLRRR